MADNGIATQTVRERIASHTICDDAHGRLALLLVHEE